MGPDSELRITLLGGFSVASDEGAVEEGGWRLRKARSLVKLLALAPDHSLHREQAMEALWPEREPAAAANNLRQALFVVRRALDSCGDDGAARLALTHDVLVLAGGGLEVDVDDFEAAAGQAARTPSAAGHRAALDLYTGELLPEDRFEPWTAARRQALRERHLGLLVEIAALHGSDGDHAAAVAALQQALVQEPLHEPAHRELMRAYVLSGRRQQALAQFHVLRESLRTEFEDEPDDETRRLYREILTRGLQADPVRARPEPAGVSPPAGNLPLHLTSFVGRERELADVIDLARRHRLLTLTGPGGCGKTRLALAAAGALTDGQGPAAETLEGAWLVELAGLSDETLVAAAIGDALGVESRSARALEEVVAAHIATRPLLVVLDNCEHLIDGCARVAEGLLRACPGLRVLATSREPLHIAGEVDWRVPSLARPEAVRLFAERAAGVSSRFELSGHNAAAVAEICERVDGMPLAVELAAARVGVLAPAQIADRLADSLAVLAGGLRTALTRQQTLTATIDWSHALLDDGERMLFRRLGVFSGTFDVDAVESVCEGELDVFARLVDKSLVMVDEQEAVARYRLLDTVRHYARQRLDQSGERSRLEACHRRHYVRLSEELEPVMDEPETRRRLGRDADQLREALRTALHSEPDLALRLAAALWRFWHDRGDRTEGLRWGEQALAADAGPSPVRARALHGVSVLSVRIGDAERALATAREAVALYHGADGGRELADELHHLATMAWLFSDYDSAVAGCHESLRIAERLQEPAVVASIMHTQGVIAASRHQLTESRRLIARSVAQLETLAPDGDALLLPVAIGLGLYPGDKGRLFLEHTFATAARVRPAAAIGYALCDLGAAARNAGDPADARTRFEDGLLRFRALGDDLGTAQALAQLGNLVAAEGDHELARELHGESLALRMAANEARGTGLTLLSIAVADVHRGDFDGAVKSAEQALALFDRTGDQPGRGAAVMQLGYIAADSGSLREGRELQELALSLWRVFMANSCWGPIILFELADLDHALGEPDRARPRMLDALAVGLHMGDEAIISRCRQALGGQANAALTPQ
jgi:predicted ATPase/DNA-binding SARP family transcriptional activator